MQRQIIKKINLYIFIFILLATLSNKNLINFQFPNINQIDILGFDQIENNEGRRGVEIERLVGKGIYPFKEFKLLLYPQPHRLQEFPELGTLGGDEAGDIIEA